MASRQFAGSAGVAAASPRLSQAGPGVRIRLVQQLHLPGRDWPLVYRPKPVLGEAPVRAHTPVGVASYAILPDK